MLDKHKNNKFLYYTSNYLKWLIPSFLYVKKPKKILEKLDLKTISMIEKRVNYYNKLDQPIKLSSKVKRLRDLSPIKDKTVYFFDLFEHSKYFNQNLKGHFLFGDIKVIPDEPSFVKSRPITENNQNGVLMKWNKVRHFTFINHDQYSFDQKKNILVSRNYVHGPQQKRIRFLEKYYGHPLCDIGKVNENELNPNWLVDKMSIKRQLEYKFILCLEGNDVASNLKWVMSSNSIAVMPQPEFETWFMEGLLIPDHHYICIKDDYSDLEEKLQYYINHPEKAHEIIRNAHDHVAIFKNKKQENIISLMVLEKYFDKTGQA